MFQMKMFNLGQKWHHLNASLRQAAEQTIMLFKMMVNDELIFGYDFTFAKPWLPTTPSKMFPLFAGTMNSRLTPEWRAFATKSRTNALSHDLADEYFPILPNDIKVEPIWWAFQSTICFKQEFSA